MSRQARRRVDWTTLALLGAMYAVLLGNFAVYATRPLPLAVHVLVSAAAIHLAFTIWHEAAHRNVSRSRVLNEAVGVLGMLPYMTPWFIQRWIHLEHHRQLNREGDPNRPYTDGPFYALPLRYPRALGYARKLLLGRDPRTRGERLGDALIVLAIAGVYALAFWWGVLLDVVLLWFVPVVIAKLVMDWYINYLPHVGLPPDRFLGTRIVDAPWLTPLILAHNYHAVHHLWPHVPWHRYPAVFRDKLEYLESHGVPIERDVFARRASLPAARSADPLAR